MMLTLKEIQRVLKPKNHLVLEEDQAIAKVEFDSRLVDIGDLFVPLKGARDGHDFIDVAFQQGALATLSDRELDIPEIYFWVEDVLEALQALAA
ncbi:UDP-N-acetylmuramoyl-tripeptide--D-alanyl-D-alanine ligase, partial [Streptococcus danieliae]|nr:UDP-N-acetylmuramoyl-tripeptide--D-alanyl-D-alanine ligase [Streptococcus danieliae]